MKITRPLKLKNPIQQYAWGSHTAIQSLMGKASTEAPWAELWMGDHPKGPSQVFFENRWIPLPDLIRRFPEQILGPAVMEKYPEALPYLFKVLAAEQPLSIQAHPARDQAKTGFEKENKSGLQLDAPERNYKDPNHKPECICALTRFTGLKGFRKPETAAALMRKWCPHGLSEQIAFLEQNNLRKFFQTLMAMPDIKKQAVISEVLENTHQSTSLDDICLWIKKLATHYPSDIGVISPLFLNLFHLSPGEALYLPAGELHAYLEGLGIELMANSDNVLRGGLTPKHVDVPELLRVLTFAETEPDILHPVPASDTEAAYLVPAEEFRLSVIAMDKSQRFQAHRLHSAEILLCTEGRLQITGEKNEDDAMEIQKGASVLVPAASGAYQIQGSGVCYKAGIPV